MSESKKDNRGGARPGAGRPLAKNKRRPTSISLTDEARARLEKYANDRGISLSAAMNMLILEHA